MLQGLSDSKLNNLHLIHGYHMIKRKNWLLKLSSDHHTYTMDHMCVHTTTTEIETRRRSGVLLNCINLSGLWKRNSETNEASWDSNLEDTACRKRSNYYIEHGLKGKGVSSALRLCDRPDSSFCLPLKEVSVFLAYYKSQHLNNTDIHHHCNITYNNQKQRVKHCAGALTWSPGFHC